MVTNDSKHIVKKISEKCFIKRSCEFYGLCYFFQHQQQPLLVLLVNIYASLCSGYFGFIFIVILPLPVLLSNFGSCILCLFYLFGFFCSCLVSIMLSFSLMYEKSSWLVPLVVFLVFSLQRLLKYFLLYKEYVWCSVFIVMLMNLCPLILK